MPRKRHGAGGLAISTIAAYLLLSVAWAAQPSEYFPHPRHVSQRGSAAQRESVRERGPPGPGEHVHGLPNHETKEDTDKERYLSTHNDGDFELETLSASQTFAPARHEDLGGLAVRAPVPAAVHPSAPINDRSLQDWVMEDLILMATVDGSLHARDRKTGQHRWALTSGDYPMVETSYNRTGLAKDDILNRMFWVVEPSDEGEIYLYVQGENGQRGVLQKLNMSLKRLVDNSPYSVDTPHIVYNAERRTTLYSFDAKTGNVLAIYGRGGSPFEDKTMCEMPSTFGNGYVESECKVEGSISLGRVTYEIWIQRSNGETLCSIRYSEWVPNKRDRDLHDQYRSSMDESYVYTSFNGRVTALKLQDGIAKGQWHQQLPNPVTRVFDVVRPAHTELRDTELVLLPQPVGPMHDAIPSDGHKNMRVYINQTKPESFYALSEMTYPTVTEGARDAQCYDRPWIESFAATGHELTEYQRVQSIVGVHRLPSIRQVQDPRLPFEPRLTIDAPTAEDENHSSTISTDVPAPPSSSVISNSYIASSFIHNPIDISVVLIALIIAAYYLLGRGTISIPRKPIELKSDVPEVKVEAVEQTASVPVITNVSDVTTGKALVEDSQHTASTDIVPQPTDHSAAEPDKVDQPILEEPKFENETETEPLAQAQTLESSEGSRSRSGSAVVEDPKTPKVRILEPTTEEVENGDEPGEKRKKARRGQRGGKQHRRKTKANKNQVEGEAEAGSVDLAVEKAMEMSKDAEPTTIQPDPVTTQTVGDPTRVNDTTLKIGNLTVFEDKILGYGSHGTRVFQGRFGDRDVAVKVMLKEFYDVASQEVNLLQESDDHRNVVRYFDKETAGGFLYIALELCPATLAEVVEKQIEYLDLLGQNGLDRVDALRQVTRGIRYLHSLKIVHRDIKPENILVAAGKKRLTHPNVIQPPRMLISDFGLCKKLDVDQSSFRATTAHAAGTSGWRAPELLIDDDNDDNTKPSSNPGTQHSINSEPVVLDTQTNRRATRAIDIFALGCIFFYVLSSGNHPFDGGEGRYFREVNIIKGRHDLSDLSILGDYRGEAEDLIASMIDREPKRRPDAGQILAHPFFWSPAKRLEFLCHVSDQFEFEPRDPPSRELQILENAAPIVLREANGDFLSKLPTAFLATLAKQRKYQGGRMLDVLRALRNKKNHYEDMPPNVKTMVGNLPEGYLLFWTARFPMLLMGCHQVVKDCGWHKKDRFREYYEPPAED